MEVQLQTDKSTSNPEEAIIMAARGDQMGQSLVDEDLSTSQSEVDTDSGSAKQTNDFETVMDGTEKSKREFIEMVVQRGHWGVLEHNTAFFAVEGVSRVTMAQITRHRHLSFDVQSMRAVDFSEKEPVVPPTFEDDGEAALVMESAWRDAVQRYEAAIKKGIPKEDARFLLPLATPVNMTFSGNLRSLLHVIDIRHSGAAQWGAQEFAEQVIEELREWAPIVVEEYTEHAMNSSLQSP